MPQPSGISAAQPSFQQQQGQQFPLGGQSAGLLSSGVATSGAVPNVQPMRAQTPTGFMGSAAMPSLRPMAPSGNGLPSNGLGPSGSLKLEQPGMPGLGLQVSETASL